MSDLETLSRDAAKVLDITSIAFTFTYSGGRTGRIYAAGRICWLHESTEACAEIMVRVLADREIYIAQLFWTGCVGFCAWTADDEPLTDTFAYGDDPMQAFRTAVLRALIEAKK